MSAWIHLVYASGLILVSRANTHLSGRTPTVRGSAPEKASKDMWRGSSRAFAIARTLTSACASTSCIGNIRDAVPSISVGLNLQLHSWRSSQTLGTSRQTRSHSSKSDPSSQGWSPYQYEYKTPLSKKPAYKGFADTKDDDMGFVEVDFSSVGLAKSSTQSPVNQRKDRDDGDVDWASIDFDKVCHYRVEVTTAAVRGAGTSGRVELTLIGDKGVSKPIPLEYDQGSGPGFMRGATLPFRVVNFNDVGKVSSVEVRLIPELSQVGHGWMLETISLTSEEKNTTQVFRSRRWFGESDCGGISGPLQQLLKKTTEDEAKKSAAVADGLKNRPRMNLQIVTGVACVPHADKTMEGMKAKMQREYGFAGEDAYFVKRRDVVRTEPEKGDKKNKPTTDSFVAFGVADGVFMWRKIGIDAGMFSRRLMGVASEVFGGETGEETLESDGEAKKIGAPEQLLSAAYAGVTSENIKGSTTACIATIDAAHGVMRTANVGDSGFMLVRGDPGHREVAHRSPHQEHEFGRPFQLGHHDASDSPNDAMLTTFPLEPGDVIVMGSDGLWDNLSESEILKVVEKSFRGTGYQRGMGAESRQAVAKASGAVVSAAYAASMDKRRTTPYSLAATENFDMVYSGGKKDDITALVVNVG